MNKCGWSRGPVALQTKQAMNINVLNGHCSRMLLLSCNGQVLQALHEYIALLASRVAQYVVFGSVFRTVRVQYAVRC
jgi:hypothetical protein